MFDSHEDEPPMLVAIPMARFPAPAWVQDPTWRAFVESLVRANLGDAAARQQAESLVRWMRTGATNADRSTTLYECVGAAEVAAADVARITRAA